MAEVVQGAVTVSLSVTEVNALVQMFDNQDDLGELQDLNDTLQAL